MSRAPVNAQRAHRRHVSREGSTEATVRKAPASGGGQQDTYQPLRFAAYLSVLCSWLLPAVRSVDYDYLNLQYQAEPRTMEAREAACSLLARCQRAQGCLGACGWQQQRRCAPLSDGRHGSTCAMDARGGQRSARAGRSAGTNRDRSQGARVPERHREPDVDERRPRVPGTTTSVTSRTRLLN